MRLEDLDEFIDDWGLLLDCEQRAGIYCITVDMKIVYVGKSKNVQQRCRSHIYNIQNAMFNQEKKYLLLLSAFLGGHWVDCFPIQYCDIDCLSELEDRYIEEFNPKLNILTQTGKNDISKLKVEDLLDKKEEHYIISGDETIEIINIDKEQDSND